MEKIVEDLVEQILETELEVLIARLKQRKEMGLTGFGGIGASAIGTSMSKEDSYLTRGAAYG